MAQRHEGMVNPALPWTLAATLLLSGAAPLRTGADKVNVDALPENLRESYDVFRVRCSKCHTLARPLNARLRGDDWRNYIKKMMRRPGSGINEKNGAQIFEFLKAYGALVDAENRAQDLPVTDAGTP
jgi:hypothetical protein